MATINDIAAKLGVSKSTVSKGLNHATDISEEMRRDDTVLVYGEDVAEMGGIFCATKGILDEFGPKRCISTPISEGAIVGSAIGAAMTGLRPCVELMYSDFQLVAFNELFHSCGKWRYLHGEEYKLPLVVRCAGGYSFGAGAEHSNIFECLFNHAPGLTIITPSNAYDAKGLLKTAIRDDDPVIFLEHKLLYAKKEEIPEEEYTIPLGQAAVKREGKDISIITWSREVNFSLEAAAKLAQEGIEAEVLDLRTLVPLDWDAIVKTVSKTHNAIIVSEEVKRGSFAGELSAQIGEELFDELDAPVERVCGLNICSPFSPVLEDKNFPHPEDIVAAVKRVLNK